MEIKIQISDHGDELNFLVKNELHKQIDLLVKTKLQTMNLEPLIIKRIEYLVDQTKYVTDSVVRNLVQQKIARELTGLIIKDIDKTKP